MADRLNNIQDLGESEDAQRLAKYFADGRHVVTGYEEAVEVMRNGRMKTEPLDASRRPFLADTVHNLHASEHIFRRRVMNRLVRPDALERYREVITAQTLKHRLQLLYQRPDPDGVHRTDLLRFSKVVFIQFAAAIIGLDASADETSQDLEDLVDAIDRGIHAKWFTTGDPHDAVTDGLAAKEAFRDRFLDPAIAVCPVHHGDIDREHAPNLVELFAQSADPAWDAPDLSVRESISFVIAALETSSALITSAVDEIDRWLIAHPEDRERVADLDFLSRVIQETLRLRPPSLPFFEREADEPAVLASTGRVIEKGDLVAVVMRAANLDERVFGRDAGEFNPYRELPPTVPRYGISFGAGQHQCLGLRVVLGNDGVGSHAYVLRTYLAAGIKPDPDRRPDFEPSDRSRFRTYPVLFTNLGAIAQ